MGILYAPLAFYRRGIAATGHPAAPCVLVFVESTPPHGVRVVALNDEALQAGPIAIAVDVNEPEAGASTDNPSP